MTFEPTKHAFTIGLFGVGLDTYWPQFEGLEQRLTGYLQNVARHLEKPGVRVVNLGLVDCPGKAEIAGHQFRKDDVDLIFLYATTYALSSTVLTVIRRAKVPTILLNLSPSAAIDYESFNRLPDRTKMTAEWLSYCQACSVPEIANVFRRCDLPFFQVTGTLKDDSPAWKEIDEWIEAGRVACAMEDNRLGLMGHYYGGMLDVYSDLTQQLSFFGGHIEMLEVDELAALRREVSPQDVAGKLKEFRAFFDIQSDCSPEDLECAARTSVAVDRLVGKHQLGSLAYYHMGVGSRENEEAISSIILGTSLLTGKGIPVAGEYEVKNAQAMKIMDLFGVGGSFTEYYAADFKDDVVLMGHEGPGHIAIAEGRIKVRPLKMYHGKTGHGLSVEMSVKNGPVTLLSLVQTADRLMLLTATGESVPGPILEIGNTNSRYRFSIGARGFMEAWNSQGPAHHCAVGVGHIATKLKKLALLLNMDCVQIC